MSFCKSYWVSNIYIKMDLYTGISNLKIYLLNIIFRTIELISFTKLLILALLDQLAKLEQGPNAEHRNIWLPRSLPINHMEFQSIYGL